jgi:hypothetical protein
MRVTLALVTHLLLTFVKLLRPGEVRAVAGEPLFLKHQLLISHYIWPRVPNLTSLDRLPNVQARHRWPASTNQLSTDHDPLFRFHRWLANLRVRDIEEFKSVPYTPVSHPFVERLIGTTGREYLDHMLFWNADDLKRNLEDFRDYYNAHRVHRALHGITPARQAWQQSTPLVRVNRCSWRSHFQGLFTLPISGETMNSPPIGGMR